MFSFFNKKTPLSNEHTMMIDMLKETSFLYVSLIDGDHTILSTIDQIKMFDTNNIKYCVTMNDNTYNRIWFNTSAILKNNLIAKMTVEERLCVNDSFLMYKPTTITSYNRVSTNFGALLEALWFDTIIENDNNFMDILKNRNYDYSIK